MFRLATGHVLRYADVAGDGPPVLFVHGLGCASTRDYADVVRSRAWRGRRALLVDLLGYGDSDGPEDFAYGIGDHAAALSEFVDAVCDGPLDLYGHSMGGAVAIELAMLHPARVRRLVVSEPNLRPGGGTFSRQIAAVPEATYVKDGHAATIASARLVGNHAWADTLELATPIAVHRGAAALVRGSAPTWLDVFARLPQPRTALYGQRSMPDEDAAAVVGVGASLTIVSDAGHSMASDNPAGTAAALAAAVA